MSGLGAKILTAHDSIRAIVIFDKDSVLLDSASRYGKRRAIEVEGSLYDKNGNPRTRRVLFEISKMISTTLGPSGRVVFHWKGGQLLGLRIGRMHVVIDVGDGIGYDAIEASIKKMVRQSPQ